MAQRSWKNTDEEWASKTEWHRACVFRPRLAEYVSTTIKKGSHVLVEGSLVSTTYERGNGKGKKAKTTKQTFRCIHADVVRGLIAANPNQKLSLLVPLPQAKRSTRPTCAVLMISLLKQPRFRGPFCTFTTQIAGQSIIHDGCR